MLPRPLRLLLDTSPPGGVVLSSFRSRDPEEGGDPGGRAVGGGQAEEEEEEEEEVSRVVGSRGVRAGEAPPSARCVPPGGSSSLSLGYGLASGRVSAARPAAGSAGGSGARCPSDSGPGRRDQPCSSLALSA